jgi:hypothetical protein
VKNLWRLVKICETKQMKGGKKIMSNGKSRSIPQGRTQPHIPAPQHQNNFGGMPNLVEVPENSPGRSIRYQSPVANYDSASQDAGIYQPNSKAKQ